MSWFLRCPLGTRDSSFVGRLSSVFATAAVTQMGFLRVSMSVACGASAGDAQTALRAILQRKSHRFLTDAVAADSLSTLTNGKDVTDAPLVRLAASHGFKLATLDGMLCKQVWAAGIAEKPALTNRYAQLIPVRRLPQPLLQGQGDGAAAGGAFAAGRADSKC
jgi:hypothetical protein